MVKGNILEQVVPSTFNTLLNLGAFLLIALYLSSKFGISVYGEVASIISLAGIFYILGDFGINHFFPKIVSRDRLNKQKLSLYFSYFLVIRTIFSIFFLVCIFLLSEMSFYFNLVFSFYLISRLLNPEIFFKSLERNLFLLCANIFSKVFLIVSFFSYDLSSYPAENVLFILAISNLILCIILFYELIVKVKLFFYKTKEDVFLVFELFKFYSARLIFNVYHQGSTFFVSSLLPYEAVGIYSIAIESSKAGQSLIGAFSTTLYVRASWTRNFDILIKMSIYLCLALLLMFIPVVIYGPLFLDMLFDFNVEIMFKLLLLLYIFSPILVINAVWGYPFFVPINKEGTINTIIIISSIIYFLCFFISQFLFDFDVFIAVACILIADFSGFVLRSYFIFKERNYLINKS